MPIRCSVLVVEDDAGFRLVLERSFARGGYEVLCAGDGEEALRVLAARPDVTLVLTDVHMPRIDGAGLIRALRADPRLRHTPVVQMTVDLDAANPDLPVLVKPFELHEIERLVRAYAKRTGT